MSSFEGNFVTNEEFLVCQHTQTLLSKGVWLNNNPLNYTVPCFLAQLSLITIVTKLVYFLLKPLKQSMASAQIIAGIIMSPAIFWRVMPSMATLYPPGGQVILHIAAEIGFTLHIFIMGVQIDPSLFKRMGKKAMLIGIMSFLVPFSLGTLVCFFLSRAMDLEKLHLGYLPKMAAFGSISAFPVIVSILAELKILNSEIGRLATYTAITCDFCDWLMSSLMVTVKGMSKMGIILPLACFLLFIAFIVFVARPLMLWLIKYNPEQPLSEINFFVIIILVLACGFISEALGINAAFGAYALGIALPDGPPFGATLISKIGTFPNELLLPIVFALSGLRTNFFAVKEKSALIIELVIMVGNVGKFLGTILPALSCGVPFWNAFILSLIMCCKGIIEIIAYNHLLDRHVLDYTSFNLLILNVLLVTGIAKPLVSFLYDPSRRYMTYIGRTIQHTKKGSQLRILVCIFDHDNIPTILNILEATNPNRYNPIAIFVLFLEELTGRASALFVSHCNINKSKMANSDHISNALQNFEQQHLGSVVVQHFTAVAPFASMHTDICTMALDKRATIIIIPFHRRQTIGGTVESSNPGIKIVNQNVLNRSPCSVGILIDRNPQIIGKYQSILSENSPPYRVAMIFLGGPDDPEALAFSIKMAEHPNVNLTVVQVTHRGSNNEKFRDFISDSRANSVCQESINYIEEEVKDSVGTTDVVRSIENDIDLIIVGRQQESRSPLISGLEEWNDCPELGVLGDVLANWDFQFSVLVVQQQPLTPVLTGAGLKLHSKRHKRKDSRIIHHASDDEDSVPV